MAHIKNERYTYATVYTNVDDQARIHRTIIANKTTDDRQKLVNGAFSKNICWNSVPAQPTIAHTGRPPKRSVVAFHIESIKLFSRQAKFYNRLSQYQWMSLNCTASIDTILVLKFDGSNGVLFLHSIYTQAIKWNLRFLTVPAVQRLTNEQR